MNKRARRRIRSSERRDYFKMLHREYDTRSVAETVTGIIEIALGNPGLAMMSGTVY